MSKKNPTPELQAHVDLLEERVVAPLDVPFTETDRDAVEAVLEALVETNLHVERLSAAIESLINEFEHGRATGMLQAVNVARRVIEGGK